MKLLPVSPQILSGGDKSLGILLHGANRNIASVAQNGAHLPCVMVMVNLPIFAPMRVTMADITDTALSVKERVTLLYRYAVGSLEMLVEKLYFVVWCELLVTSTMGSMRTCLAAKVELVAALCIVCKLTRRLHHVAGTAVLGLRDTVDTCIRQSTERDTPSRASIYGWHSGRDAFAFNAQRKRVLDILTLAHKLTPCGSCLGACPALPRLLLLSIITSIASQSHKAPVPTIDFVSFPNDSYSALS